MLKSRISMTVIAGVVFCGIQAEAGLFKNVRYALGYTGFGQRLQRNAVSDGWTYDFAQTFNDKEYDFGNSELNLTGSMEGSFNFSRRGIPEVEFNLSTPAGLSYDFLATDGPNRFTIDDGFLDIEQKIIFNQFGGYDIELQVTNRGTLVYDNAELASKSISFDVGPINVHGQWLVDVFNLTVGRWLGFSLPGGGLDQLALGWDSLFSSQVDQILAMAETSEDLAPAGITIAAVPEPLTMLLMAMGGGLVLGRRI